MKWSSLIFLFTCLLMQKLVSGQDISASKTPDGVALTCTGGTWKSTKPDSSDKLSLKYQDEDSETYTCEHKDKNDVQITVKFRTCDNCIELDAPALSAIIVGNLVATFLIACAVYSITRQPKGRNFSGNKASDKVNLLTNGEGDTYQQLTPGQNSEYSRLEGVRKK